MDLLEMPQFEKLFHDLKNPNQRERKQTNLSTSNFHSFYETNQIFSEPNFEGNLIMFISAISSRQCLSDVNNDKAIAVEL